VPRLFERVTIVGVGLIGGSFGLAARAAGLIGEVVGCGRGEANLRTAQARGIIDRFAHDPAVAARDADLLLLAVPVNAIATVARACAPALRAGAVVTDVGSVKAPILTAVEAVLPAAVSFVGAHPIAGTEDAGAAAADPDLFRGRRCIVTPGARASAAAVSKVRGLWEGVGMQVEEMTAARHDEILAWVSHLPHALAFSTVNALLGSDAAALAYGGPSFRDLTRVAGSSPATWCDIFLANAAQVDRAITAFIATLNALRDAIVRGDEAVIKARLTQAQAARRQWSATQP
jgi:prephenate dehydrogenase